MPISATSSKIQCSSMLNFVLSSITAEDIVSIQQYENKFKNEFLQSRISTLQFFRENDGKMSHILPPTNNDNS